MSEAKDGGRTRHIGVYGGPTKAESDAPKTEYGDTLTEAQEGAEQWRLAAAQAEAEFRRLGLERNRYRAALSFFLERYESELRDPTSPIHGNEPSRTSQGACIARDALTSNEEGTG